MFGPVVFHCCVFFSCGDKKAGVQTNTQTFSVGGVTTAENVQNRKRVENF